MFGFGVVRYFFNGCGREITPEKKLTYIVIVSGVILLRVHLSLTCHTSIPPARRLYTWSASDHPGLCPADAPAQEKRNRQYIFCIFPC